MVDYPSLYIHSDCGIVYAPGAQWAPEGGPWNVGIASPDDVEKYVEFFDVTDGSVATSGDYEKGAHITDPHTGLIAIGARSASVIGLDGALCDALATALMVDGIDALKWIGRPELVEHSFWIINRHYGTTWSYGPNKGIDLPVALNNQRTLYQR